MSDPRLAKAGYLTAAIMRYKEQDYRTVRDLISRVYDHAYQKGLEAGQQTSPAKDDDDRIVQEANAFVAEKRSKPQPPPPMTIIKGIWNYMIDTSKT